MIVRVRPFQTSLQESQYRPTYTYRSGSVKCEEGDYVVVPFGSRYRLGQVVEVARRRDALSGRIFEGELKTIVRKATVMEKSIARDIQYARRSRERATARIIKQGHVLERLAAREDA